MGKNLKLPLAGVSSDDVFESDRPAEEIAFRPPGLRSWFPNGVDNVVAESPDEQCTRCSLGTRVGTVCMDGRGPFGAPLIVLPTPSDRDDRAGELLQAGETGMIMAEAHRITGGSFRVTHAVRCCAGREPAPESIAACRRYLAQEIDLSVTRVVLVGQVAAEAALGVPFNPQRLRRARAHVRGVPAFLVQHPHQGANRNKHHRRMFQQDLEWALTTPLEVPADGVVRVLDAEQAVNWLNSIDPKLPIVVDAEHWPKSPWSTEEFRLLCLGLCQHLDRPVVLPEEVLKVPSVVAALARVMEEPAIPKVNQAIKHDSHVLWRALRIDLQGVEWDTLMAAKLLDSDAPAGLVKTSWLVGYGGYKELGHIGSDEEDDE